jgi:hypothetical protein
MIEAATTKRLPSPALLAGIALLGAAISLAIGLYASEHDPTGESILGNGLFFSATLNMKAWLATVAAVLALFQVYSALRIYDRIGFPREMPPWFKRAHHLSGTLAVLISLPVAYHCVWALGYSIDGPDSRVVWHGLLGCFFYGAFAAKMLFLRVKELPGLILPIVGGLTFTAMIGIWLTSGLWFFDNFGFPSF